MRLRRSDFRCTTILLLTFSYIRFFSASGEAMLGTQRYLIKTLYISTLSKHFAQALYPSTLHKHFIQALYTSTLSKHLTQALYPCTLHKHFIYALYTNTLSMHFTQALYQSTLHKHFIKVFLKHFRNTYQTSLYKLISRGEVLRSITC